MPLVYAAPPGRCDINLPPGAGGMGDFGNAAATGQGQHELPTDSK